MADLRQGVMAEGSGSEQTAHHMAAGRGRDQGKDILVSGYIPISNLFPLSFTSQHHTSSKNEWTNSMMVITHP